MGVSVMPTIRTIGMTVSSGKRVRHMNSREIGGVDAFFFSVGWTSRREGDQADSRVERNHKVRFL